MRSAAIPLLVTAVVLFPAGAPAQTAYSIDFGAITAFDRAATQIGFRAAPSLANQTGPDILLATFPDALIHGLMLFVLDADATYGARLDEHLTLFPRVGGSVLAGGGGSGGGAAALGYNVGLGLLGRASTTLGVRIDYTRHWFMGGGETLPTSSLTLGFVWMR